MMSGTQAKAIVGMVARELKSELARSWPDQVRIERCSFRDMILSHHGLANALVDDAL